MYADNRANFTKLISENEALQRLIQIIQDSSIYRYNVLCMRA